MLCIAAIVLVEGVLGFCGSKATSDAEALRFASATLTLGHTMAIFGAKRPQNSAWQLVVLTLWAILVWPALEVWLRGKGEPLEMHALRSWFLVILVVAGTINHLPTRFTLPGLCVTAAQVVLLWPQLPFNAWYELRPAPWVGLMVLVAGVMLAHRSAAMQPRVTESSHDRATLPEWSFVWREFRDWFGVVWSMRVMERMNASAAMYGWPVALGWGGFVIKKSGVPMARGSNETGGLSTTADTSDLTSEQRLAIENALRALLRRFVSPDWIERRLARGRTYCD